MIAYVFVGPQDLPKVARWIARAVKRLRLMASEIKAESGWDDLLQETQEIHKEIRENKDFVQKNLRSVQEEIDDAEKSALS